MINSVVDEFEDKVHFVEINIERDPEIAEAAGAPHLGYPLALRCHDMFVVLCFMRVSDRREPQQPHHDCFA
jgi:hypothetical protein